MFEGEVTKCHYALGWDMWTVSKDPDKYSKRGKCKNWRSVEQSWKVSCF